MLCVCACVKIYTYTYGVRMYKNIHIYLLCTFTHTNPHICEIQKFECADFLNLSFRDGMCVCESVLHVCTYTYVYYMFTHTNTHICNEIYKCADFLRFFTWWEACRSRPRYLTLLLLLCCSVLQCVAVCCSVSPCVAVCCSVLQCIAVCCSVLQCMSIGGMQQ